MCSLINLFQGSDTGPAEVVELLAGLVVSAEAES
jgi:hypothetical protein